MGMGFARTDCRRKYHPRMPRLSASSRRRLLAGLYAAIGITNCVSVAKRFRSGELATKPLLMPLLVAYALMAAGERRSDIRFAATGMLLSGLGDTALLG